MSSVLVIDDSRFSRQRISSSMDQIGYRVFHASNGEEGLKILKEKMIDCILLDITMPVLDGRAFLKILRKKKIITPVIVITADIQESTRKEVIGLGAKKFLSKPVKKEEVLKAVLEVIKYGR
ncbi:MAG: response regulator [Candidatus Hodarchaeales archaeon]